MILCDSEIKAAIRHSHVVIDSPPPLEHFTTSALDLKSGDGEFKRWRLPQGKGINITVDASQPGLLATLAPHFLEDVPRESDGSILIPPGGFVLALTHERVELPESSRLAARVEGRSSLARLGVEVHVTAPTVHSGFEGQITLEITNHGVFPIHCAPACVSAS